MKRILLLLAISLFALLHVTPVHADNATCWVYEIEIEGNAGGYLFENEGVVVVFPYPVITNTGTRMPANQWEFRLQVGTPWASPRTGSIFFITNTALVGDGGNLSQAMIQSSQILWDDDEGYFVVEPLQLESELLISAFNISSGVTADAKIITAGGMAIAFSEDYSELEAAISFAGRNWMTPSSRANVMYEAYLVGEFVEETDRCFPRNF